MDENSEKNLMEQNEYDVRERRPFYLWGLPAYSCSIRTEALPEGKKFAVIKKFVKISNLTYPKHNHYNI